VCHEITRLFDHAGFAGLIAPHDKTAIKLHFGEKGIDGFISPVYVRQVVEKVKACGGLPFLTDTNTPVPWQSLKCPLSILAQQSSMGSILRWREHRSSLPMT
jgi:uncharacterized Fe-S center protein